MAATTQDRDTPTQGPIRQRRPIPLAVGAVIPRGVIIMVTNATGLANNATDTAATTVVGVSAQRADETQGDTKIVPEQGIYKFAQNGSITQAMVGGRVYVIDNQTVGDSVTAANDIPAGILEGLESDGVWVNMTQAVTGAT